MSSQISKILKKDWDTPNYLGMSSNEVRGLTLGRRESGVMKEIFTRSSETSTQVYPGGVQYFLYTVTDSGNFQGGPSEDWNLSS